MLDIPPDGSVVIHHKGRIRTLHSRPGYRPGNAENLASATPVSDDLEECSAGRRPIRCQVLRRKSVFDEVFDNISP